MAQRFCEVCGDPLPLEHPDTMCESCTDAIRSEVALIEEGVSECETSASVEVPSSSAMPAETILNLEVGKSTSENSVARVVTGASELDDLDLTPAPRVTGKSTNQSDPLDELRLDELRESPADWTHSKRDDFTGQIIEPPTPAQAGIDEAIREAKKDITECEACGYVQSYIIDPVTHAKTGGLHSFKHPHIKEPLLLCDTCYAGEVALTNHTDDPMQGKIVHPDEHERSEILTMDDEDRILYNDEVLINASTPLDDVEARVNLLERRLHRAKLQLKASKRVLLIRVENMKKEDKDAYYREAGARLAKKRTRSQGDASGTPRPKKSAAPKRTKAQQFRDSMKSNGFSDAWIDEQIKKMGLED